MNHLERFQAVMEYQPFDRVPNWELGAWFQARLRWAEETRETDQFHWDWFSGEAQLGMDPREFIRYGCGPIPAFEEAVLEEDEETQVIRDSLGRTRRALKPGAIGQARMSMDTYLSFPVESMSDWREVKKRFDPRNATRYEPNWSDTRLNGWKHRTHPLIFAPNCSLLGFYWKARDLMGTENLSYAWYDQPDLMHDMMAFWGDFIIEAARPVLEKTTVEYINLNEDLSMKTGPLLSPETYRQFIFPHLKRVVEFCKSKGCRYFAIDTDGNPEVLVPLFMDAGVDILWPLERAADQDPLRLRKQFGKNLRLWGGVDKRELTKGPAAIDAHLRTMRPLIEEGGFIPTVDHTVPPDVSWANFRHYMDAKARLLAGKL